MQKILLAEDDRELNQSLCYALKREGYSVVSAFSVKEARMLYQTERPHLILLDVNLPDGEGYEFCRWVKEKTDIPVLFLTARDLEEDVLRGYELGAWDYVAKPFSMNVLLRKLEVILRHMKSESSLIFDDGYLRIDLNQAKFQAGGNEISLTPTEHRLLKELVQNRGQLLTYSILLDRMWDAGAQFMDKHALAVNINRLRGKLEDSGHKYISNVYGMGYQWIGF